MNLPSLKKENIIAFDPGETTGICVIKSGITCTFSLDFNAFLNKTSNFYFNDCIDKNEITKIICESWRLYPNMAKTMIHSEFLPVQIIGMIKVISYNGATPIKFQTASAAKKMMTNDKIKQYGFGLPKIEHEKDALRHALYYFSTKKD